MYCAFASYVFGIYGPCIWLLWFVCSAFVDHVLGICTLDHVFGLCGPCVWLPEIMHIQASSNPALPHFYAGCARFKNRSGARFK